MENLKVGLAGLGAFGGVCAVLFIAAMALLHIMFTVCVWNDATRLRERGRATVVLTPFVWGLAALLLGFIAVAFYWVCHYSQFFKNET